MRAIKNIDILDEPADALIYSTNVLLNCSGGVGADLVKRYGQNVQADLHKFLTDKGTKFAQRGDIYEHVTDGIPYAKLFHTVPSNGWYETTPEIIKTIIGSCLSRSLEHGNIKTVVMSVLATGYGTLLYEDFFRIANQVINQSTFLPIEKIIIAIHDPYAFDLASQQIKDESLSLSIISPELSPS